MTQRLYDAAKRVADAANMSLDQRLAIAEVSGAGTASAGLTS